MRRKMSIVADKQQVVEMRRSKMNVCSPNAYFLKCITTMADVHASAADKSAECFICVPLHLHAIFPSGPLDGHVCQLRLGQLPRCLLQMQTNEFFEFFRLHSGHLHHAEQEHPPEPEGQIC